MRIATSTIYDLIRSNLSKRSEEMVDAQKVVASGRRINDLSDDPVGLMQALNIKSSLQNVDQLGRNIAMGTAWLDAAESALSHSLDLISDARVLAIQMANATVNSEQRNAAAGNVQHMIEEIVSLGNSRINGRYLFSGTRTDAAPFDDDGTYNGNSTAFRIKIGNATAVSVGSVGEEVFGAVFTTLQDLKTALETDDVGGITDALDRLGDDSDRISGYRSEIGAKGLRMEIKKKIFLDLTISGAERLSGIEDADMAEAITRLQSKELIYKAALASSSKIMSLSLVDYVR